MALLGEMLGESLGVGLGLGLGVGLGEVLGLSCDEGLVQQPVGRLAQHLGASWGGCWEGQRRAGRGCDCCRSMMG